MTLKELHAALKALGYPTALTQFKKPQSPPYIVYILTDPENFSGDNMVYHSTPTVQVEVYTKDLTSTGQVVVNAVKNVLKDIYYTTEHGYISEEKLYMTVFRFSIEEGD